MEDSDNKFDELLKKFLDRSIPEEEYIQLQDYLDSSEENRELFKSIVFVKGSADAICLGKTDFTEIARGKVGRKLNARARVIRIKKMLMRVAAILAIPLLFSTLYLSYRIIFPENDSSLNQISYLNKQVSMVRLFDGTIVYLHTGSTLSYPDRFSEKERNVLLDGEGYFQVKSDPDHPFFVQMPDGSKVRVYGTIFNVRAYKDENTIAVFLKEGHVDFINEEAGQSVVLNPGEELTYNSDTHAYTREKKKPEECIGWIDGKLIFNDSPMDEVVRKLSKHYDVNIVVRDKKLNSYRFNAQFRNETIYQILNMLKLSSPDLSWRIVNPGNDSIPARQTIILEVKK